MAAPMRSTDFRSIVEPILNECFDGVYDQRADEWSRVFREQEERTREANRLRARERMIEALALRERRARQQAEAERSRERSRKAKRSRMTKKQMVETKRRRSAIKAGRKNLLREGD